MDTTRASLTVEWVVCSHPSVVDWPFEHTVGGASVMPCTAVVYNSRYGTGSRNNLEVALFMHAFIVYFMIITDLDLFSPVIILKLFG